jgi:O-antigen ligase
MGKEKQKSVSPRPCLMVLALAVLSFIVPLKFANPVVIREAPFAPKNSAEWILDLIYSGWPNAWFYTAVFLLSGYGIWRWLREKDRPRLNSYVLWVPAIFLLSQFLSASKTVHTGLTSSVLLLLSSIVAGFYLGAVFVREENHLRWILLGWCIASVFVISSGLEQTFGGLEQTRRFYLAHPEFSNPELWKKLQSNRIFATLVYPNSLGGFIISAVFLVAAYAFHMGRSYPLRKSLSYSLGIVVSVLLCFCLWKSQSKGAYVCLFATVLLSLTLLIQGQKRLISTVLIVSIAFLGIFAVGYGRIAIEKAKKSGEARAAYWKAAVEIGKEYPLLGSGPGTFSVMYPKYKNPEDEDTRLVHNNYLQMWSDSGVVGFISFMLFLPGMLALGWMKLKRSGDSIVQMLVWCACSAFALHSLIDFDLYMVSNSWPIFVLLGSLANLRISSNSNG